MLNNEHSEGECVVKKAILLVFSIACCFFVMTNVSFAEYPERNINGYIMWGSGGALDNVSRAVTPAAETRLGKKIILQNKPGATGAVALTYVYNMPADGYTLLYGSENPLLYKVLGITDKDYEDFYPLMLFINSAGVVCVRADSPYKDFADLIRAAKTSSKLLNAGSTGPAGLPFVASSLIRAVHGVKFNDVSFDGEGPCITALLGGHIDVVCVGAPAAVSFIRSGKVRALAVISDKRVPQFPDVPSLVEISSEYGKFFPWGPFHGVFVKKGTPDHVIAKLTDAFRFACNDEKFDKFAHDFGGVKLALTGTKAVEYIRHNQSVSAWLLHDMGYTKRSPEEFGIPRP